MSAHQEVKSEVRQIAGLTLKAEINKNFARYSNPTIDYLKQKLLIAFFDP